ncbi:hypothetical protein OG892_11075 [Streptomyces sp. NBC_00341]|uniref:hypothetical protein n=1 Tax=Streptomyces sp. NBC_00341 TaxID=2975717 RepID=UPI0030916C2A|nr:hypothetical protein OG892_11075 [Streptomyces sp. NBC_00341]
MRGRVGGEGRHAAIRLPEGSWWDRGVASWNAGQLRPAAGHDLAYRHGLELVFDRPAFVGCPTGFHDPVLRFAPWARSPEPR